MFNPYYYKKVDLAGEAQLKQRQVPRPLIAKPPMC